MTESQARETICRVGKSLFDRSYVHATAGNISLRLGDGSVLITPTDACLGLLDPARLAHTDAQGVQISGDRASKTLALHRRIYSAAAAFEADICCVIHSHGAHCVALTLAAGLGHASNTGNSSSNTAPADLLPPLTPYFVMKVGHVPLLPYRRPGAAEVADDVAAAIAHHGQRGTPLRAVMLPRLGANVWHRSAEAAMATLEELEETARLQLLQPGAEPLSEAQIEELRQAFGARW